MLRAASKRDAATGLGKTGGSLVALAALCILGFGGCTKSETESRGPSKTAVVVPTLRSTWIRNFNPFFESQAQWPATAGIYEPLIIFNRATSQFVPWLATSWKWTDDNRTLVLEIRKGVEWADGELLEPSDVAYTFELMKTHNALDQFAVWTHVKSVEVRGDEVHFHFKRPFVLPALFLIGRTPIIAEHVWKNVKDPVKFADEYPVGTGPFNRIVSFKNQSYEVGKNPRYWQKGKPNIDRIRVPAYPGNEQLSIAIIRGEIDWGAGFLPAIDRIFVNKDPKHRGYYFPSLEGTVMLYANHAHPPYDRVDVRKALSYAIDRDLIVRIAMQGYTRKADATAFSDLYMEKWHDPKVLEEEGDWTKYQPETAEAMLDASGLTRGPDGIRLLPDGKPWEVDVNCVIGWGDWIIASQIIVKNLKAIGIDATLRTYEFNAWFDRLQVGNFDLSISWSDSGATPWSFYQRLMSKDTVRPLGDNAENNWHRYANKRADELLAEFASTSDPKELFRLASELQRVFVRNAPTIPLFPGPTWGLYNSRRVEGFPNKDDPYAPLAPYKSPGQLLTLVELRPAGTKPSGPRAADQGR